MSDPGWVLTVNDREAGKTEPSSLEEAVYQSLGAASVCWSETPSGEFDSTRAAALGKQLVDWVDRHYYPRGEIR